MPRGSADPDEAIVTRLLACAETALWGKKGLRVTATASGSSSRARGYGPCTATIDDPNTVDLANQITQSNRVRSQRTTELKIQARGPRAESAGGDDCFVEMTRADVLQAGPAQRGMGASVRRMPLVWEALETCRHGDGWEIPP